MLIFPLEFKLHKSRSRAVARIVEILRARLQNPPMQPHPQRNYGLASKAVNFLYQFNCQNRVSVNFNSLHSRQNGLKAVSKLAFLFFGLNHHI